MTPHTRPPDGPGIKAFIAKWRDNPPLLVVSDRKSIDIHTRFTGTPSEAHNILLEDIGQPEAPQKLRRLFESPG